MYESLMTLLFFPDWTNGLPSDFLILHFFVGAVIFPFNMIHAKARKIDSQKVINPDLVFNSKNDLEGKILQIGKKIIKRFEN